MQQQRDIQFIKAVLMLSWIDEERLRECAQLQQKWRNEGRNKAISDAALQLGYLSSSQIAGVYKVIDHAQASASIEDIIHELIANPEPETLPVAGIGGTPAANEKKPAAGTDIAVKLPDYKILRKLGAGGMGVVYLAEYAKIDRVVAIKMILSRSIGNAAQQKRFSQEAEAVARLDHPHIIKVYDARFTSDLSYIAMQYIDGAPLHEYVAQCSPTLEMKLLLVAKIAKALHYAHRRGILHRDIKPSNIMVSKDGVPYLMDFGLAKFTQLEDKSLTKTGELLGTPKYMSPEQAYGKVRSLDARCDIYSLGTVLYELVTGRSVITSESTMKVIYEVIHDSPPSPRQIDKTIPPGVEAISLKALEKKPRQRYQTAKKFADDIESFLAGRPIEARLATPLYRMRNWLRRRQIMVGSIFTVIFICICTGIWFYAESRNIHLENNAADEEIQKDARPSGNILQDEELREKDPVRFYILCGDYLEGENHLSGALQSYLEAWNLVLDGQSPKKDELLRKIAILRLQLGRFSEAQENFAQLRSDSSQDLLLWARTAFHCEKYDIAIDCTTRVLADDKADNRDIALYFRGISYAERHKYTLAIADLQQVFAQPETSRFSRADLCYYLGICYLQKQDNQQGARFLQMATAASPTHFRAFRDLGEYLLQHDSENYREIARVYEKCVELRPWVVSYHKRLGRAYRQLNKHRESDESYLKAMELDPNDFDPLLQVVDSFFAEKLLERMGEVTQLLYTFVPRWIMADSKLPKEELFHDDFKAIARRYLESASALQKIAPSIDNWEKQLQKFLGYLLIEDSSEATVNTVISVLTTMGHYDQVRKEAESHIQGEMRQRVVDRLRLLIDAIEKKQFAEQLPILRKLLVRHYVARDGGALVQLHNTPKILEYLRKIVHSEEEVPIRFFAANAIWDLRLAESRKVLDSLLADENPITRIIGRLVLANNGRVQKLEASDWQYMADSEFLQAMCVQSFPLDREQIADFMRQRSKIRLQLCAARELWETGDSEAAALFLEQLQNRDPVLRKYALNALWRFLYIPSSRLHQEKHGKKYLPHLLKAARDDDADVRQAAIIHLFFYFRIDKDPRALKTLIERTKEPEVLRIRFQAIARLAMLAKLDAIKDIILDSNNHKLLRGAGILGLVHDNGIAKLAIITPALLNDPDSKVRTFTLRMVGDLCTVWGNSFPMIKNMTVPRLKEHLFKEDPNDIVGALAGLLGLAPYDLQPRFQELLTHPDPQIRKAAAANLAYLYYQNREMKKLQALRSYKDPFVDKGAAFGCSWEIYKEKGMVSVSQQTTKISSVGVKELLYQKFLERVFKVQVRKKILRRYLKHLQQAEKFFASNPDYIFEQGVVHYQMGQYADAIVDFQRLQSLQEKHGVIFQPQIVYKYWQAKVYAKVGPHRKARLLLEEILQIRPWHKGALQLQRELQNKAAK